MWANATPAGGAASRASERRHFVRDDAGRYAEHGRVAAIVGERDRILQRDRALAEAVRAVDHAQRDAQLAARRQVVRARAPDDGVRAVVQGGRGLEAEAVHEADIHVVDVAAEARGLAEDERPLDE